MVDDYGAGQALLFDAAKLLAARPTPILPPLLAPYWPRAGPDLDPGPGPDPDPDH